MRRFLVILCCLWPEIVLAQGFAVHDLTILAEEGRTALGEGTTAQAQPVQLVLTCATCEAHPRPRCSSGA